MARKQEENKKNLHPVVNCIEQDSEVVRVSFDMNDRTTITNNNKSTKKHTPGRENVMKAKKSPRVYRPNAPNQRTYNPPIIAPTTATAAPTAPPGVNEDEEAALVLPDDDVG